MTSQPSGSTGTSTSRSGTATSAGTSSRATNTTTASSTSAHQLEQLDIVGSSGSVRSDAGQPRTHRPQAQKLLCYLYSIKGNHVLSGQQEANWNANPTDIAWYTNNGMKFPAILGSDFLYRSSNSCTAVTQLDDARHRLLECRRDHDVPVPHGVAGIGAHLRERLLLG